MLEKFKSWFAGLSMAGRVVFVSVLAVLGLSTVAAARGGSGTSSAPRPTTSESRPKVETKTTTETSPITFIRKTVDDDSMEAGRQVTTKGVDGVKAKVFKVTITNGKETNRQFLKEEVVTAPIDEVTRVGTKKSTPPASADQASCNSNYSGCVPNASDVDCLGGSGNGPAYTGATRVIGVDVYGLDRDGNGMACE